MTDAKHEETPAGHPVRDIEITVNNNKVVVDRHELTGLQIKEAAIAQGVKIQADFVLFKDLNNGQQEIVKDDQVVKLHNGLHFDAVTNDDNS